MKTANIRSSRTLLVLLRICLFICICVCLPRFGICQDDGFKNGCFQFADKEMERFAIDHCDNNKNKCIEKNEIQNIKNILGFHRSSKKGNICDSYGIKTLDDLAHLSIRVFPSFFQGCKSLETIHLPNVYELDAEAFKGCSNLREVELKNLKVIGDEAFADCSALPRVDFPQVEMVRPSAFYGATKIQEIILPNAWIIPNNVSDFKYKIKEAKKRKTTFNPDTYYISNSPVLKKLVLSSPHEMQGTISIDDGEGKMFFNPLKGDLSPKVTLILNESQKRKVESSNGRWANAEWKSIQFVGNDKVPPLLDKFKP